MYISHLKTQDVLYMLLKGNWVSCAPHVYGYLMGLPSVMIGPES